MAVFMAEVGNIQGELEASYHIRSKEMYKIHGNVLKGKKGNLAGFISRTIKHVMILSNCKNY